MRKFFFLALTLVVFSLSFLVNQILSNITFETLFYLKLLFFVGLFFLGYLKMIKKHLNSTKKEDLSIKSILTLDKNSRFITLEFGGKEYLIFSSSNGSIIVDSKNIKSNKKNTETESKTKNILFKKELKEILKSRFVGISSIFLFLLINSTNIFAFQQGEMNISNSSFIHILVLITLIAISPALILMLTPFTRIVISLSILRHAIGLPSIPSNQIITALSIFISFFIMRNEIEQLSETVIKPYLEGKIKHSHMIEASKRIITPFLIKHTGEKELKAFIELSQIKDAPTIPFSVLVPAFVCSEIKKAFKIGVMIYIPFIMIDLVVSSILMSIGMIMLPPAMISLPIKLLVFVMVDGWRLIIEGLYRSFV